MLGLKETLLNRKLFKEITLFFDIETLQYNEKNAKIHPSDYRNMTYSVAFSWLEGTEVSYEIFQSFKEPFNIIIDVFKQLKKKPIIQLIAHNNNKYDNHYLRKDLLYYYPHMTVENFWLSTADDIGNEDSYRLKDLTKEQRNGILLEKRIKSSINLELTFFLYGQKFYTTDNWVKSNLSLAVLGKKLKRLGVITDDELKTDYNYTQYNKDENMTEIEARTYAKQVFNGLDLDEQKYIRNDVIILAKAVFHYSEIFKGFDYSKKTFTSNILESYNTNDLTSFQLLNRIGEGKEKIETRYTDYEFANQNFYDYLKPFYRGGLNFYNQFYVGKKITSGVFGMDIHSSYPFAMHNFKIPTYIKDYEAHDNQTEMTIDYSDDYYTLFQLSKETFDTLILDRIESVIFKQILVKYYSTNEFININTYTFKLIENVTGLRYESIPAFSRVTFETSHFGSREQIETFYKVKTQGKEKSKLIFNSPYDIIKTDEENDLLLSPEEVDNSKVNLNGLYGIPALRPFFNLFRKKDDQYVNIENGHKNAERNIVFSIFVTSVSLWNLLDPLKNLTQKEIDENLLYCDTDSLYIKKDVQHKIPQSLFTKYHLGTWELEHDNLTNFYVLNHKKYAYEEWNDKTQKNDISVRSGGIAKKAFNFNLSFDEFIDTQFSHGVEIENTKSIYNSDRTISIYPSKTRLEVGGGYRIHTNNKLFDGLKKRILSQIKESVDEFTSDVLYIESSIGTFSLSDVFPYTNEIKNKEPLLFLLMTQENIRTKIENNA